MATVVFNSAIAWGDVLPLVPVAHRLIKDGHRVRFVVPTGFHETLNGLGLGIDVIPSGYELSPRELERDRSMDADRWAGLHWERSVIRRYVLPHTTAAYQALDEAAADADLLVTQQNLPFTRIVAERRNLPWATFATALPDVGGAFGLPAWPQHPLMMAGRRAGYRGADRLRRWWVGNRPIDRLRRDLGLAPLRVSIPTAGVSPYLVLVAHSPAFINRPDDWPDTTKLSGLSHWDRAAKTSPPGLAEFVNAGHPPVLVTLGATPFVGVRTLIDEIVVALRSLGLRGLFLMPHGELDTDLGDDMAVFGRAPLVAVMRASRAVVHRGDYASTGAALIAGCPMVVVGRHLEHRWYARRAAELGVGLPSLWRPEYPSELPWTLRRVVSEPSFADHARLLADRLATDDGPGRAARELLNLLHSWRGRETTVGGS